jgi:hypothetical protein
MLSRASFSSTLPYTLHMLQVYSDILSLHSISSCPRQFILNLTLLSHQFSVSLHSHPAQPYYSTFFNLTFTLLLLLSSPSFSPRLAISFCLYILLLLHPSAFTSSLLPATFKAALVTNLGTTTVVSLFSLSSLIYVLYSTYYSPPRYFITSNIPLFLLHHTKNITHNAHSCFSPVQSRPVNYFISSLRPRGVT